MKLKIPHLLLNDFETIISKFLDIQTQLNLKLVLGKKDTNLYFKNNLIKHINKLYQSKYLGKKNY